VARVGTSALPWFAVGIVVFVASVTVIHGMGGHIVEVAAILGLLGACICAVVLGVRDNPVSAQMIARRDVVHGSVIEATRDHRSRRARRR